MQAVGTVELFHKITCPAPGCGNWLCSVRGPGTEIEVLCRRCRRIIAINALGQAVSYRDGTNGEARQPADPRYQGGRITSAGP